MGKIHLVQGDGVARPETALSSGATKTLYCACMRCGKPISYSFDYINITFIKALGADCSVVSCCRRCYRDGLKVTDAKLV